MTASLSTASLDRSMARAVAWNAVAKWTTQIASWGSTIVVARLLTPNDYGLVGMAGLYLSLATLINQIGIGDAIVALRDLTRRQIAELNTVALFMGATLVTASYLLATPIARFFATPSVRSIVIVMGSTYVISALQIVPRALLQKELRFKLLASNDIVRAFCQMIVTLALAWMHFGYWSLVWGTVASSLVSTILILCSKRRGFAIPRFRNIRRELRFGRHTLFGGLAWYVYDNADFAIAGRMLGGVPLGYYTVAWTIATAPIEKIANLLTGVTPAFFSAVQSNQSELRRYLLRISEALSLIVVPISIGIALIAPYLVPVVLGSKWDGAVGPLRLLGIFIAFRTLAEVPPRLLNAIADTRFTMWAAIAAAVVMPLAFFIGSRWGGTGIAASWVLAYPPMMAPVFYRVFRKTQTRLSEYLYAVAPALIASSIMAAVVFILRMNSPLAPHAIANLSFLTTAAVVSYLGALLLLFRQRVTPMISVLRSLDLERRKHREQPPQSATSLFAASKPI